jgi:hypothetical protein
MSAFVGAEYQGNGGMTPSPCLLYPLLILLLLVVLVVLVVGCGLGADQGWKQASGGSIARTQWKRPKDHDEDDDNLGKEASGRSLARTAGNGRERKTPKPLATDPSRQGAHSNAEPRTIWATS